jgi:hypothetical protein
MIEAWLGSLLVYCEHNVMGTCYRHLTVILLDHYLHRKYSRTTVSVSTIQCFTLMVLYTFWELSSNNYKTCEISSSHGGEYEVQNCLLGCTAV